MIIKENEINYSNAFMPESNDRCMCVMASGVVTLEGYTTEYIPRVRKMVETYGEIRLLVYYKDFKGWKEDAALLALGDPQNTRQYIKKLAMVNAPESELARMALVGHYPSGSAKIFSESELQAALKWVKS